MHSEQHDAQTGEVINGTLVRVQQEAPIDLLAIIEKRNHLLERVLEYAIKATHTEQWFDLGGKPWPSGPACEAMARRCGVSIANISKQKRESSDDKGDFYIWEVTGTASLPSGYDSITCFGTCTSRDSFLGTETRAGRLLSEIDEGSVMKAAYTNMEVNAITRLLGVRNLSWDRLAKAGLDRTGMGKVEYDAGAKGGSQAKALTFPYGDNTKGKAVNDPSVTDKDLSWWADRLTSDVASNDEKKVKYRPNNQKLLDAVKAEQASRANKAAGTTAPASSGKVAVWERLKQLAGDSGVAVPRLKELVKAHLQKDSVDPGALTEADLAAVAVKLAAEPKPTADSEKF